MIDIQEQINQVKQTKKEYLQELYYVDYCNNCKTGLASKYDIPCHHPYYCWHDNGEIQELQTKIVKLQLKPRLTTQEYETLKTLKTKQRKKTIEGLRQWRKTHS